MAQQMPQTQVCMVCLQQEGGILFGGICNCAELYVHETCLKELLTVPSHQGKCPVCKGSYDHFVRAKTTKRLRFKSLKLVGLCVLLHFITVFSIWSIYYVGVRAFRGETKLLVSVTALSLSSFAGGGVIAVMIMQLDLFNCFEVVKEYDWIVNFEKLVAQRV